MRSLLREYFEGSEIASLDGMGWAGVEPPLPRHRNKG